LEGIVREIVGSSIFTSADLTFYFAL